LGDVS
jgi:hypothetical protein